MSRTGFIGQQKGRAPVVDFNTVNLLELDDTKRAKLEYWICKQVGEYLMKVYPNRQWEVIVHLDGSVLIVKCPSVSLTKGYHIHMRRRTILELQQEAKRAAGEILERHGVTRAHNFRDFAIFDALPTTLRGDVIAPDAAPLPIEKVPH